MSNVIRELNSQWNLIAPCGLYCRECIGFLSAKCGGCRSNQGLSGEFRKYCRIYECSENKGFELCLDCASFPCRFFKFFEFPKGDWFLDNLNNMKRVKKHGIVKFLKVKSKWLRERGKCAESKDIDHCGACEQRPCKLLGARPVLVPVNLDSFKKFMKSI